MVQGPRTSVETGAGAEQQPSVVQGYAPALRHVATASVGFVTPEGYGRPDDIFEADLLQSFSKAFASVTSAAMSCTDMRRQPSLVEGSAQEPRLTCSRATALLAVLGNLNQDGFSHDERSNFHCQRVTANTVLRPPPQLFYPTSSLSSQWVPPRRPIATPLFKRLSLNQADKREQKLPMTNSYTRRIRFTPTPILLGLLR